MVTSSFSLKEQDRITALEAVMAQSARKESSGGESPRRAKSRMRTPNTFPRVTSQSRRDMGEVRKVLFDDVNVDEGGIRPQQDTTTTTTVVDTVDTNHDAELEVSLMQSQILEMEEQLAELHRKRDEMDILELEHDRLLAASHSSERFGRNSPDTTVARREMLVDIAREHDRLMESHEDNQSRATTELSPRDSRISELQATVIRESPRRSTSSPADSPRSVGSSRHSSNTHQPHVSRMMSAPPSRNEAEAWVTSADGAASITSGASRTSSAAASPRPSSRGDSTRHVVFSDPNAAVERPTSRAVSSESMDAESAITHEIFNYLLQQGTAVEDITEDDIRSAINAVLARPATEDHGRASEDNMSLITHLDHDSVGAPESIRSLRDTSGASATTGSSLVPTEGTDADSLEEVLGLQEELQDLQNQMSEMRSMADKLGIALPDYPGMDEPFGAVDAVLDDEEEDDIIDNDESTSSEAGTANDPPEEGLYGDDDRANESPPVTLESLASSYQELANQKRIHAELSQQKRDIQDRARLAQLIDEDASGAEVATKSPEQARGGAKLLEATPAVQTSESVGTDDIYREVSWFILQHESRPGFVVNFFKALKGMNSDYECERLLAATDDIKRFVQMHPELKATAAPADMTAAGAARAREPVDTSRSPVGSHVAQTNSTKLLTESRGSSRPSTRDSSVRGSGRAYEAPAPVSLNGTASSVGHPMNEDLQRAMALIDAYPNLLTPPATTSNVPEESAEHDVSEEDLRDLIRLNDRMQRRMTDMKAEEQKAQADIAGMSGLLKALSMAAPSNGLRPRPADVAGA